MLERVTVTSYVTPLREGGSLPGLVEADNLGTYVLKFRGAGHGALALVAEIIAGELARRLGLRTPELALAWLDPRIAASEPDQEIQDLLRASEGLNLAVDFLPGSAGFEPAARGGPVAPVGRRVVVPEQQHPVPRVKDDHPARQAHRKLRLLHAAILPDR